MRSAQIHAPADPSTHGALFCDCCETIHGRCLEAVYPFLHMAKVSGNEDFLRAGIAVFEWSENVTLPSGAWTNGLAADSWQGTTLFGAIALAEVLREHGDLLDARTRRRWFERLRRAGDFIYGAIKTLDYANINYGCTAIYGMHLLGTMLDRPVYLKRAQDLLGALGTYISEPSGLLIGEGKPADGTSPRGCRGVDLGYNVEESLPSLALAATAMQDRELLATVRRLLNAHLELMLPDGAWDNSFGTRHAKWTYYGSRTSDGCQMGYALLAKNNPAFATAVIENTRLMRRCTANNLLAGGPHCHDAGIKPCVHHTFTHAKALATVRDHGRLARGIVRGTPLPRATAEGIRHYPEMATWLAARGDWRATITACDYTYRRDVRQPSGGCLSMLWHQIVGPIVAGSMPRYVRVEPHNMQVNPFPGDHPLTPRLELEYNGEWYTQLYDLNASVNYSDTDGALRFEVGTRLLNASGQPPPIGRGTSLVAYTIHNEALTIEALCPGIEDEPVRPRFVLPVIAGSGEVVRQVAENRVEIEKKGGLIVVEAARPLHIPGFDERIFNLVPGFEALPISAEVPPYDKLSCRLTVRGCSCAQSQPM